METETRISNITITAVGRIDPGELVIQETVMRQPMTMAVTRVALTALVTPGVGLSYAKHTAINASGRRKTKNGWHASEGHLYLDDDQLKPLRPVLIELTRACEARYAELVAAFQPKDPTP